MLHTHLPLPLGLLPDKLALWLQGALPAEKGCLDRVVAALATRGSNAHTLRRRLCGGLKDDGDQQDAWRRTRHWTWKACFALLLSWVLSRWYRRDRLVALTVSMDLNQTTLPMASLHHNPLPGTLVSALRART